MKKEVLEKLYGSKVELSEVKVDLALADDIKKQLSAMQKVASDYPKFIAKAKQLDAIAQEIKTFGKFAENERSTTEATLRAFNKAATELGIDKNSNPDINKIYDLRDEISNLQQELSKIAFQYNASF